MLKKKIADNSAETVFDLQGACLYLKTSYRVLKNILNSGEIHYRKVGAKYFIHRQALDQWLLNSTGNDE